MSFIDWSISVGLLALLAFMVIYTRHYTRSVVDFLAANRCAGRYLICVASGISGLGAITIIANFEMYYNAGFTAAWWQLIWVAVGIIMPISGWFIYRFRETRALTLAQFLEMRYSRKFRVFAGLICYVSGILNFGIFPSVSANFFIHYCGLPDTLFVYALIMSIVLAFALFFTLVGGQIAVIITEFIQGTFCNIMFVVILISVMVSFQWPQINEALQTAPANASLLHPFQTQDARDFNLPFFLIYAFTLFYITGTWQGSAGYNSCALNAHEARMGNILFTWRVLPQNLFMMMLPICAYAFLHHSDFSTVAQHAKDAIANISNPQIQKQMTTPISMRFFLPKGVLGLFAAIMLATSISTHATYMHSWGSIFIQDVLMPLKKKTYSPQEHITLLRRSIFAVAIFSFLFSLIFRQTEYIMMFMAITGAIFTGGGGAVVIGGLYWKRGTAAAAWTAMITGCTLSVTAMVIRQIQQSHPFDGQIMSYIASKNSLVLGFWASVAALGSYVIVSLIGKHNVFNMDKMLHRGVYAVEELEMAKAKTSVSRFRELIGMGSEFTTFDKVIYLSTMGWTVLLVLLFITGTIYSFAVTVKTESWSDFWHGYVWVLLSLSVITTLWFLVCGFRDLKKMLIKLGTIKRDISDDGAVGKHEDIRGQQEKAVGTMSKSELKA